MKIKLHAAHLTLSVQKCYWTYKPPSNLTHLNLYLPPSFPSDLAIPLLTPIKRCTSLETLNLNYVRFEEELLNVMGEIFIEISQLRNLSVSFVLYTYPEDVRTFGDGLKRLTKLRSISLRYKVYGCSVHQFSEVHLFECLSTIKSLQKFRFCGSAGYFFDVPTQLALANFLSRSQLRDLRTVGLNLSDVLIDAIRSCHQLVAVNLEATVAKDQGLQRFLQTDGSHRFPESVSFGFYRTPGEIVPGVYKFTGLKSLSMKLLAVPALVNIIECLIDCDSLSQLSLRDIAEFDNSVLLALAKLVELSTSIRTLEFYFGFGSCQELCDAIINSKTLRVLKLRSESVVELVMNTKPLLQRNTFLKELCLGFNKWTGFDLSEINFIGSVRRIRLSRCEVHIYPDHGGCGSKPVVELTETIYDESALQNAFTRWQNGDFLIERIVVSDAMTKKQMSKFKETFYEWFDKGVEFGVQNGCMCLWFQQDRIAQKILE
ncbi:hypothetical protein HK098_006271 [Nowakowskiella sp. JEL0407]|nr:hypothetical protein HK098_006271 [Nowakowskiella sp. JEL0407]